MAEPRDRYSKVSILLHWTIAALILTNVWFGWQMSEAKGLEKFQLFQTHKSIGLTVLLLSLARLGWRIANPAPPLPAHMARWEKLLARATHVALYVLMIGVPMFGWATVSSSPLNIPTELWGVVPWPHLPLPHAKALSDQLGEVHETLVLATFGVLALHVAGALKHQFVDRDEVLWRMLPIVGRPR